MEDTKPRVTFSTSRRSILKNARTQQGEASTSTTIPPLDSSSGSFPSSSSPSRQLDADSPAAQASNPPPTPISLASRLHTALMSNETPTGKIRRRSTPPPSSASKPRASSKKVELWEDDKGRKGEVWCHGCGERVAGLRFACQECLSFELCSTCFPELDSSLQHSSHHHFQFQVHPLLASRFPASTTTPILLPLAPQSQSRLSSSNMPQNSSIPQELSTQIASTPPPPRPKRISHPVASLPESRSPSTFPGSLPALHLYPTSESFEPKLISLPTDGCRIIIGRRKQLDPSQEPSSCNGYFEGKVLSRSHAEVWFEEGKFLIRDLGSVNGTYLSSERLAPFGRGLSSESRELRSEDLLDFGSATGLKISCKVHCVLTEKDEKKSLRSFQAYHAFNRRLSSLSSPSSIAFTSPDPQLSLPPTPFHHPSPTDFPLIPTPISTFCELRTHSPVQVHLSTTALVRVPSDVRRYSLVDEPAKGPEEWEEDWSDKESVPDSESS